MDMANQFLALSLFIMLLSFFIILNALSNFEEVKSKPVLNSLVSTFSNNAPEEVHSPNVVESLKKSINEGDTLDNLKDLFNAHITGAKISKNRLGTIMHIRMPLAQFESSLLTPSRNNAPSSQRLGAPGTFAPTLVSLMQTRETKIPYRMDMIMNTKMDPASAVVDAPEQVRLDMRKISTLSKRLEESGMQKKLISAGLIRGEVGMIDIYFTRYEPVNPLQKRGQNEQK